MGVVVETRRRSLDDAVFVMFSASLDDWQAYSSRIISDLSRGGQGPPLLEGGADFELYICTGMYASTLSLKAHNQTRVDGRRIVHTSNQSRTKEDRFLRDCYLSYIISDWDNRQSGLYYNSTHKH